MSESDRSVYITRIEKVDGIVAGLVSEERERHALVKNVNWRVKWNQMKDYTCHWTGLTGLRKKCLEHVNRTKLNVDRTANKKRNSEIKKNTLHCCIMWRLTLWAVHLYTYKYIYCTHSLVLL